MLRATRARSVIWFEEEVADQVVQHDRGAVSQGVTGGHQHGAWIRGDRGTDREGRAAERAPVASRAPHQSDVQPGDEDQRLDRIDRADTHGVEYAMKIGIRRPTVRIADSHERVPVIEPV
jgi:hypothetical protein